MNPQIQGLRVSILKVLDAPKANTEVISRILDRLTAY